MRRLLAVLAVYTILVLPAAIWATGSLTIPNTIFTKPNPVPTSLLDQNWAAIATYVNAREVTFGLLAARPAAGTAGRYFFATDQNGGTFYADTGTAWTQLAAAVSSTLATSISSLTLSNNSTATATFKVLPGQATSDDTSLGSRVLINHTADITKSLGAWAVGSGNGCLDTGAAAVFTWYHVYIINRIDTGVVDVLCSTSATSPTMPSSYTKKRRIGAIRTDWSTPAGSVYFFSQDGDRFMWATKTMSLDVNNATPGTNANTATFSVPNGVSTQAILSIAVANTGNVYVSSLAESDEAPSTVIGVGASGGGTLNAYWTAVTNNAQQLRYRSNANVAVTIVTLGYIDRRGQQ